MPDIKSKYSAANQTITVTLNALASSATAGRASTAVDTTTNLYLDALVQVHIDFPNSAPANDRAVYVYAYASANDGTNYTGSITGTDAAYTMNDPTPLRLIGVIPVPTQNIVYRGGPFSVAVAFGGILPSRWGIFVRNYGGQTLGSTSNAAFFQGVFAQSV